MLFRLPISWKSCTSPFFNRLKVFEALFPSYDQSWQYQIFQDIKILKSLKLFWSTQKYCKNFWSLEKWDFWIYDRSFDLMKNANFDLMKFNLLIMSHGNGLELKNWFLMFKGKNFIYLGPNW
jgi:hypothetical protein